MSETPSDEINSKFSLGEDNGDLYILFATYKYGYHDFLEFQS